MAQRTAALCNGKYIGIESIHTVIDGRQINISKKLKELKTKSRKAFSKEMVRGFISYILLIL